MQMCQWIELLAIILQLLSSSTCHANISAAAMYHVGP
jgi:hypothetical protein